MSVKTTEQIMRLFKIKNIITYNQLCKTANINCARFAHATASHNEYYLDKTHIEEVVKANPKLAGINEDFWKRTHETLANHGINTNSFMRIVCGHPAILRHSPQRIIDSLEQWRGCQFGEKNVHLLVTKYPEILVVDNTYRLHNQIAFLRGLVQTHKNVWKVLMNSPDLIEQTENIIQEKFDYLIKEMRLDVSEIVKSCALSKSLDEIRTRHVFQLRLGIFKPRKLKANPLDPSTNDRLYKIIDTSEKTFATKICHVTLEEYEVFKELFQREISRKANFSNEDLMDEDELQEEA